MNNNEIYRLPEVMRRTGLSRSTIYELIGREQFPTQILLGPRAVGWVAEEVSDWIGARIRTSRATHHQMRDNGEQSSRMVK